MLLEAVAITRHTVGSLQVRLLLWPVCLLFLAFCNLFDGSECAEHSNCSRLTFWNCLVDATQETLDPASLVVPTNCKEQTVDALQGSRRH